MGAPARPEQVGAHAWRCSGVPCEKEPAGEAVARSNAGDTHHYAKGVGIDFVSTSGAHKPLSHHTSVQELGTTPTLTFHVEIVRG